MEYGPDQAPVGRGTLGSFGGRQQALAFVLVATVTAAVVAAMWLLMHGGTTRATAAPRPPTIGQFLPTPFGSFGVRAMHVEPTGVPRGVDGITRAPRVVLQVVVTLVNVGKRTVELPLGSFLLHGRPTDPPALPISPREPVELTPSNRIDVPLEFVVARPTVPQRLHFAPTPDAAPIFVNLVRSTSPSAGGGAHDSHAGH